MLLWFRKTKLKQHALTAAVYDKNIHADMRLATATAAVVTATVTTTITITATTYTTTFTVFQASRYKCNSNNICSYFSTKTYVVGTQKNRLTETVLLSTPNKC